MTQPDEFEDAAVEGRLDLQNRIANALAELSEVEDTPETFQDSYPEFSAADVEFETGLWRTRLAEVQAWLHLDDELVMNSPAEFDDVLAAMLGVDASERIDPFGAKPALKVMERLSERAEAATRLQQLFLDALDDGGRAVATRQWEDAWDAEFEEDDISAEPVTAKAEVWPIYQLTTTTLNLAPSYQRGDVWDLKSRQLLVESILRGIPLPSLILLKTGPNTPHEVVDGKQRLTTILRFVGLHPIAVAKVKQFDAMYPDAMLLERFQTDYPAFRRAWKRVVGESLSTKLESEYYFPFKLRDGDGGLKGNFLEALRGKYYTECRDKIIRVAAEEIMVQDLFERTVDYKVPVILYTRATNQQIHEVFKLYNKQGVKLNAEEIRNAIYHELSLTKALLVGAGDYQASDGNFKTVAPALGAVPGVLELGQSLQEYGFGESRYKRTKVLGWVLATLLNDYDGKELPATARHIDVLLNSVQNEPRNPLRKDSVIADIFDLLARSVEVHSGHAEIWSPKFKDGGNGAKWQELQLVGSLIATVFAVSYFGEQVGPRLESKASVIRDLSENSWARPKKTQTKEQWKFIAQIVREFCGVLEVDLGEVSNSFHSRYGSSGVASLLGMAPGLADG